MLPNGPFYQDTGGNWVFVVAPDGSHAERRNVRLGRRNPDYVEVVDGLKPGEKVIVSGYEAFQKMDRVEFEKPQFRQPIAEGPMITLKHLAKVYRTTEVETTAMRDMNLEVRDGEFVAVMGPSGCGKSTFLNIVGMLDSPSAGEYWFDGQNIAGYSRRPSCPSCARTRSALSSRASI